MADRYAVAAASASVAALAEAAGFDLIRRSASDTLAEILMRYLEELGAGAHAYAEEAGRADPNAVDLVREGGWRGERGQRGGRGG